MAHYSTPLVGRSLELAALERLIEGTDERAVIVSGDAGVGKTRLLAELLDRAQQRRVTCVVGHCLDFGDAGLPYLPFGEAFATLSADADVAALLDAYPAAAAVLPAVRTPDRASSDRRMASAVDDERVRVDKAGLYDSVLAVLEQAAARSPLLLIIEDAHWADQATRDLIGFVLARTRSPQLSLVVSYRSDDLHRRHPLRKSLAQWSRLGNVRRLQLSPLDPSEVRSLVRAISPWAISEGEIGRIVERAGGNAFFAEELLSATTHAGTGETLPADLADLLLIRLDRLSAAARDAVRVTAVAGGRISHNRLSAVTGLSDDALDDAVREAVEDYVLEAAGEWGYRFRHALLSEAVYDDLLPGERVRLHAAFARVLRSSTMAGSAAELAHHARRAHDLQAAFEASIQAGGEALELAAPQEAMTHFEAALGLLCSVAPPASYDWASLIIDAVEAAADAGHPARALAIARDAVSNRPPDLDPEKQARLLATLARASLNLDADVEAMAATTKALSLLPADGSAVFRARLSALHAHAAVAIGRDTEAARWAQEAIEAADAIERPEVASDARTTLALIERRAGDPKSAAAH
ncbi:MAG: AAA family ATPase, partial [Actinobacteria bacterium]|nr:AAA family ATPase [Actinomycetota bacterium]